MELFVTVMNAVNDIIWHPVMCVFLMCAAIWFTVRLRGIQVRISKAKEGAPKGIWQKPEDFAPWMPKPTDTTPNPKL